MDSFDERTLCCRCANDYTMAGFELKPIYKQYREPCDICGRLGYEYYIYIGGD